MLQIIKQWFKKNKQEQTFKPLCNHPSGRWRERVIEEPVWDNLDQRYEFPLVKRWVWYCEQCRGRN